ncbi:hypothetical protein F4780DRAFT_631249 [Xylariomycetidae sp. FL0641]|nr:hypothetical protein F4780DRAFT_631249 [Xylariomycetidae sp. FL0641]
MRIESPSSQGELRWRGSRKEEQEVADGGPLFRCVQLDFLLSVTRRLSACGGGWFVDSLVGTSVGRYLRCCVQEWDTSNGAALVYASIATGNSSSQIWTAEDGSCFSTNEHESGSGTTDREHVHVSPPLISNAGRNVLSLIRRWEASQGVSSLQRVKVPSQHHAGPLCGALVRLVRSGLEDPSKPTPPNKSRPLRPLPPLPGLAGTYARDTALYV